MSSNLFKPFQLGTLPLQHRVVLAPLTRNRADRAHVPSAQMIEHYAQRASTPGTLLIAEATFPDRRTAGLAPPLLATPGIYTNEQVAAWKKIVDAVHAKGSFIFLQLWALGRCASPADLAKLDPSLPYVSTGSVALDGSPTAPRPLTRSEIAEYVQLFATAASNAVHGAGFDGVEIHGATGYLVDQFLKDYTNNRTDEYGGSVEGRAKFALEVVEAMTKAVGEDRVGLRLSPWVTPYDNKAAAETHDPIPTYSYLVRQLRDRHPSLAYLHFVEPRVEPRKGEIKLREVKQGETNGYFREIWGGRPWIAAGGFMRETAVKQADERGELVAFGRWFISNPDLPVRLRDNLPLTPYDRPTFYVEGSPKGYNDFPRFDEQRVQASL